MLAGFAAFVHCPPNDDEQENNSAPKGEEETEDVLRGEHGIYPVIGSLIAVYRGINFLDVLQQKAVCVDFVT